MRFSWSQLQLNTNASCLHDTKASRRWDCSDKLAFPAKELIYRERMKIGGGVASLRPISYYEAPVRSTSDTEAYFTASAESNTHISLILNMNPIVL